MGGAGDEAQVAELFAAYEAALVSNDVDAMNAVFATDDVVRFGIAEVQWTYAEVESWRATAAPVDPRREITAQVVRALAPGVVAVDITFRNGTDPVLGRQSQTWVRHPDGWRIARAHVSMIAG